MTVTGGMPKVQGTRVSSRRGRGRRRRREGVVRLFGLEDPRVKTVYVGTISSVSGTFQSGLTCVKLLTVHLAFRIPHPIQGNSAHWGSGKPTLSTSLARSARGRGEGPISMAAPSTEKATQTGPVLFSFLFFLSCAAGNQAPAISGAPTLEAPTIFCAPTVAVPLGSLFVE